MKNKLLINTGVSESFLVHDDLVQIFSLLNLLPMKFFKLFLPEDQIGVEK